MPLNSYISLNRPLYDEDYEITLLDVLGEEAKVVNPEEIMINKEQYADIERKLQKLLSSFERSVLNCYLQGKSYQEIGAILGRDPKSIDNALQRIKKKIDKMRS
jgi:RNA polymerase sporulation-specific sigma factor